MITQKVYINDLEGRIDPHFYQLFFKTLENRLQKLTYKKLGDIVSLSSETWNQKDQFEDKFPYIEISEIDILSGEINNITYQDKKEAPSRAKMIVRENDIIVSTTRPHRGAIAQIDKEKDGFIASTGFAILRKLKTQDILKSYLYYFLRTNLALNQLLQRSSGGNYPAITSEELQKLIIPTPSIDIQNKIILIMQSAYKNRKEKLKQADELLNPIDSYVFDKLGIKMSEIKDKMCFVIDSEEIKIGRIDPNNFLYPQDTPSSNKFKEMKLSEVANFSKGQSITSKEIVSGDYHVVAGGQISPYTINKFNHKGDVITVSASGAYSGYVWYHEEPIFASDCTVIKTLDKDTNLTFYLYCVMKAKQKFIYNMQQGAGQPHVYSRDLSNLKIPLPSLHIQNKIVKEVKLRTQKAEGLQEEAKEELEKAKKKVEEMILN